MEDKKTAVVAGHICLDVLPKMGHLPRGQFESLFRPGHLISVGEAIFSTGGPVSNVGLALHRLGVSTKLIAKVGDDPYGRIVCQIIEVQDINLLPGIRVDPDEPTSYSIIISPPGVDRIFLHCPGVNNTFKAKDIDQNIIAEADLMHFGYPPIMRQFYKNNGAELVTIFQKAKAVGITTSLDMAFPDPSSEGGQVDWRNILEETLPYVDIFLPSIEEILFMLHRDAYQAELDKHSDILANIRTSWLTDLSNELLEMGAKIILLKLGHRGVYLRTAGINTFKHMGRAAPSNHSDWANQEVWSPCYKVDVIGTTGSGDATIAGFLGGILRDFSPLEAVDAAVAVGACNVEASDALSGLLSWEETMSRIAGGWKKHSMSIQTVGWTRNANHQVWISQT